MAEPAPPGSRTLGLRVIPHGHEVDVALAVDLGPAQVKDVQPPGLGQVEEPLPLVRKGPIAAPGHKDLGPGGMGELRQPQGRGGHGRQRAAGGPIPVLDLPGQGADHGFFAEC